MTSNTTLAGSKRERRSRAEIERALCVNTRRLVSPFDVHATLLHLLSYPAPPKLPDWSTVSSPMRPRSLLVEVPAARRCDEAGIPGDACPCR